MSDYQPVNCEFHDIIEACATLRNPIAMVVLKSEGPHRIVNTVIKDVFAKDGAEYLHTNCGKLIRLDQLITVDGHNIRDFVDAKE